MKKRKIFYVNEINADFLDSLDNKSAFIDGLITKERRGTREQYKTDVAFIKELEQGLKNIDENIKKSFEIIEKKQRITFNMVASVALILDIIYDPETRQEEKQNTLKTLKIHAQFQEIIAEFKKIMKEDL